MHMNPMQRKRLGYLPFDVQERGLLQSHRALGLQCLAQCARSLAQHRKVDRDLSVRLDRTLEPIVSAIRKGSIASSISHLQIIHELCLNCMPFAPVYVVELLVMLLAHESWECIFEGIRTAIDVMVNSANRLSQAALPGMVSSLRSSHALSLPLRDLCIQD
jgi:hypothetical protein